MCVLICIIQKFAQLAKPHTARCVLNVHLSIGQANSSLRLCRFLRKVEHQARRNLLKNFHQLDSHKHVKLLQNDITFSFFYSHQKRETSLSGLWRAHFINIQFHIKLSRKNMLPASSHSSVGFLCSDLPSGPDL